MNLVHGIKSHILYSNWIYIYIYGNKQLIVSDADSLTFIAQSSEECVPCIWNVFCCRISFHEQSTAAVRGASTLCKPQRNIFINLLKRKCHFDEYFINDCTGRQLPLQPVMKISFIKMIIFPFQCSCKLNHTNIPCRTCPCVHNTLRPRVFI